MASGRRNRVYETGKAHPGWKGDEASYHAVHLWMNKHFPRTGRCEWCGRTDRPTEYASASHSRYTRNRADWFEFCKSCHARFDGRGIGSSHDRGKLTAAEKALIRVRVGSGEKQIVLAREFGVSKQAVRQLLLRGRIGRRK